MNVYRMDFDHHECVCLCTYYGFVCLLTELDDGLFFVKFVWFYVLCV